MKHFILEATYLVPFETISPVIPQHREYLQRGYDLDLFLCSGPKRPADTLSRALIRGPNSGPSSRKPFGSPISLASPLQNFGP